MCFTFPLRLSSVLCHRTVNKELFDCCSILQVYHEDTPPTSQCSTAAEGEGKPLEVALRRVTLLYKSQ